MGSSAPAAPAVRSDLEVLQGSWESVAGTRQARLLVADSHDLSLVFRRSARSQRR